MEGKDLVPSKSYGIFVIGANIGRYLHIPYVKEYLEDNDNISKDYVFYQDHIIVWTDKKYKVMAICCEAECYWKGQNLLGLSTEALTDLIGEYPVYENFCYTLLITKKKINQQIYTFSSLGISAWIWQKKVRRILIYDAQKTELSAAMKKTIRWLIETHDNIYSNKKKKYYKNKDEKFCFIPNISYGVFHLGNNINNYFHLPYLKESTFSKGLGKSVTYIFYGEQLVEIWTDKSNKINTIRCDVECYWKNQNLIGMYYGDFIKLANQQPDSMRKEYVPMNQNRGQNQTVYDFNKLGLMIWVWRNKIRTVLISKYIEE